MRKVRIAALFFSTAVISPLPAATPEEYVEYLPGDIPLILAVPHDGREPYPGVSERSNPNKLPGFNKGRDQNTSVVAHNIRALFEQKTGKKPYVVILRLSRKWIDANREEARAVEDERIALVYRHFYAKLHEAKGAVLGNFGKGLILDIHCGAAWRYDVYFGTRGVKAIKPLIAREGKAAFSGEFSIQQHLASKGYEIPGYNNIPYKQGPTGNLIQDLTWADKENKLDGIEIEINSKRHLNKAEPLRKLSTDLGEGILTFFQKYYAQ